MIDIEEEEEERRRRRKRLCCSFYAYKDGVVTYAWVVWISEMFI